MLVQSLPGLPPDLQLYQLHPPGRPDSLLIRRSRPPLFRLALQASLLPPAAGRRCPSLPRPCSPALLCLSVISGPPVARTPSALRLLPFPQAAQDSCLLLPTGSLPSPRSSTRSG